MKGGRQKKGTETSQFYYFLFGSEFSRYCKRREQRHRNPLNVFYKIPAVCYPTLKLFIFVNVVKCSFIIPHHLFTARFRREYILKAFSIMYGNNQEVQPMYARMGSPGERRAEGLRRV